MEPATGDVKYENVPLVDVPNSVLGSMKWSATYTRYFVLGIQLPPALQSQSTCGPNKFVFKVPTRFHEATS